MSCKFCFSIFVFSGLTKVGEMVFQQFLSCQITEEKITQLKQNPNQTLSKLNVFESCISKEKGRISEESKKKKQ